MVRSMQSSENNSVCQAYSELCKSVRIVAHKESTYADILLVNFVCGYLGVEAVEHLEEADVLKQRFRFVADKIAVNDAGVLYQLLVRITKNTYIPNVDKLPRLFFMLPKTHRVAALLTVLWHSDAKESVNAICTSISYHCQRSIQKTSDWVEEGKKGGANSLCQKCNFTYS